MKNFGIKSFILTVILLLPAITLAETDMFLKIEGAKGESKIVKCVKGTCVVPALAAGDYSVLPCDATGKVSMQDMHMKYLIVSPRDSASGMSSGKRMHQPIRIYQKIDKSTPVIYNLKINEAGSQVVIGTDDANVDAGVAKISKSRSNIQNN